MKAIVSLIDGLPVKDPAAQLDLTFDKDSFVIVEKGFAGFRTIAENTFRIPLKNIISTMLTTEKEFQEKDKSVIGRGVVGGVIFGPAGLVLGGLSGIGKKQTAKNRYLYIVSYVSASSGELENITFTMPAAMNGVTKKFDAKLHKQLQNIDSAPKVLEYRNAEKPVTEFNL